jgi:phytoene synthase
MKRAPARSHFFVAFRVLPRDRFEAITAVYDFCRRADDAVDESPDRNTAEEALRTVRAEIDRVFRGDERGPLAEAVVRFALPRRPFDDLLEGVSWDLEGRRYATRAELERYCARVASAVGLLCVRIFGCPDGSCDVYAERLGIAMQWTNVLRDIAPDLRMGRLYLPGESMARHGLDEEALRRADPEARARLRRLIHDEAAFARAQYAAAEAALPERFRRTVLSGQIMAAVYRSLLRRVERAGDRVLDRKIRVGNAGKAWAFARTVVASRLRGGARDA